MEVTVKLKDGNTNHCNDVERILRDDHFLTLKGKFYGKEVERWISINEVVEVYIEGCE